MYEVNSSENECFERFCALYNYQNENENENEFEVNEITNHRIGSSINSNKETKTTALGACDSSAEITLRIGNDTLIISQSLGLLNSSFKNGTTGGVVWSSSILFAQWLTEFVEQKNYSNNSNYKDKQRDYDKPNEEFIIKKIIQNKNVVVELGAGCGGVLACTVAHHSRMYIATDQIQILKLLSKNIEKNLNINEFDSNTISGLIRNNNPNHLKGKSNSKKKSDNKKYTVSQNKFGKFVDVFEFDWEYSTDYKLRLEDFLQNNSIDIILACDTIYNTYLIPFFVDTLYELAVSNSTVIVIVQQLRSEDVLEVWIDTVLQKGLKIYAFENEFIPQYLRFKYAIYYLFKP